jgi:hypothetical protein
MAAGLGSGSDPAADGFEYFGLAEIGNQETKDESVVSGVSLANVSTRARDAFDHAALFQLPERTSHGDSRRLELLNQSGFAWELLARLIFPGEDIFRQALKHLLVFWGVRLGTEVAAWHNLTLQLLAAI